MTLPILIHADADQFTATVVGIPDLYCSRPSKAEAIAALQHELQRKISSGELVNLEVSPRGVSGLAGRYADDETLRDICDEIYRERDADRAP